MGKRIEYTKGKIIGPYGLIFIKEADPYINPSNGKKTRQAVFECPHCKDKTHFITRISYAKNGHTKSCGCQAKIASIKTIQQYNDLGRDAWNKQQVTSEEYVGEYGVIFLQDLPSKRSPQNRAYRFSKFICPVCNQEFEALFDNVKRGKTKGCGHHISYGEEEIVNILHSNNINFISHYNNKDCINPKTG